MHSKNPKGAVWSGFMVFASYSVVHLNSCSVKIDGADNIFRFKNLGTIDVAVLLFTVPYLISTHGWKPKHLMDCSDVNPVIGLDKCIFFVCKIVNIFLPISFSTCFWCSKELPHGDGSFEYPQLMFWLRNKKMIFW